MKPSNYWWLAVVCVGVCCGIGLGMWGVVAAFEKMPGGRTWLVVAVGVGVASGLCALSSACLAVLASRQEQKPAGGDRRPEPGGRA